MNAWHDEDDRDPLLDACLAELLGDESPPDLTARIMAAWQASREEPTAPPAPLVAPATTSPVNGRKHADLESTNPFDAPPGRRWWPAVISAAVVLLLGTGLGVVALKWTSEKKADDPARHTAKGPQPAIPDAAPADATPRPPEIKTPESPPPETHLVRPRQSPQDLEPPFAPTVPSAPSAVEIAEVEWPDAIPDSQIVSDIDAMIQAQWEQVQVQPAPPATDAEWCRRVYVRLLGRIPTVEELQRYVDDSSRDKRRMLVDTLIYGSQYADEFASHWASHWTNVMIGRTGGRRPNDLASREGLFAYFRGAILEDRSFREITEELIAASGSGYVGDEQFNGAANFLLTHANENQTTATGVITRVFLGQRFHCAQCHDHPGNAALTQRTFWELNAFLRQTVAERDQGRVLLVDRDMDEEAVFFEQPDGVKRAVLPVLPDGTVAPASGKVSDVRRREILARWVAASADMPRAVVDRTWAHFFGYGFTYPLDDAGPNNPPSHPELREHLAGQFAAHGYDLRKLMSWISLSDPFHRSSMVTEFNLADRPEQGSVAMFSRYYARRMFPEAVYDSLRLVADARRKNGGAEPPRQDFLGQFAIPMDNDESEETHLFRGNIRQSVLLMTAPLMQRAVNSEEGAVLRLVQQSEMSIEEKVTHLFLAAIARPPHGRELDVAVELIQSSEKPETALQDIWWALLNSSEFVLDR